MPNETSNKDTKHLPRHIFRKQLKKGKRRQRRQKEAIQFKQQKQQSNNNNNNNDHETATEAIKKKEEEEEKLYLQQKAQWEEKERQYNIINMARKKVIEAEKKARELAMEKWSATLRNMPMPTPEGYSSTDSSLSMINKKSVIQKQFTSSSSSSSLGKRKTYRQLFEESKLKKK